MTNSTGGLAGRRSSSELGTGFDATLKRTPRIVPRKVWLTQEERDARSSALREQAELIRRKLRARSFVTPDTRAAAVRKLAASAALIATRSGRSTYAKRSDILALVDRNPIAPKAHEVGTDNDARAAHVTLTVGKAGAR